MHYIVITIALAISAGLQRAHLSAVNPSPAPVASLVTASPVLFHNASHYCSQFDQCDLCLRDHTKITNATKCSFKVCSLTAPDKIFSICYPSSQEVPCPDHIEELMKIDDIQKCSEMITSHSKVADGNATITTTTPPSNGSQNITTISTTTPSSNKTTPVPSNSTTSPPTTTTITTITTKAPTSPITKSTTTHKTTTMAPITVTSTVIPVTPSGTHARFSPSSFVGGMCLMAGIATLIFFGVKYYKSNVSRYRQF